MKQNFHFISISIYCREDTHKTWKLFLEIPILNLFFFSSISGGRYDHTCFEYKELIQELQHNTKNNNYLNFNHEVILLFLKRILILNKVDTFSLWWLLNNYVHMAISCYKLLSLNWHIMLNRKYHQRFLYLTNSCILLEGLFGNICIFWIIWYLLWVFMFFELLAIETKMIWNLFTILALLLLAFWTLKPVLGVMPSHWRSYHFSIKSFLGSISRLSFFELILLMTLLAFNQIESFRIKLTLKFAQNSSINNILDLIIDNLHFAILSRTY